MVLAAGKLLDKKDESRKQTLHALKHIIILGVFRRVMDIGIRENQFEQIMYLFLLERYT